MTPTSTSAATIRTAVKEDLPAIEQMLRDADLPTAGVADILNSHPEDFFVAESDSPERTLVGIAGLEVCSKQVLLRSVAVRPEWRSHGVGRELVRRAVCAAEARNFDALYLLTMTAEHYFPRFGFHGIERSEVPPEIADTLEFKSACPASAKAMVKALN